MTGSASELPANPPDSWRLRAKASLAGGVAAALVAPLLFFVTVLATPPGDRGFWRDASDVFFAVPTIWLFAGLVALPASLLAGPLLVAGVARVPRASVPVAVLLGAVLGALVMNAVLLLVGARSTMGFALSVFAAAVGAVGSGVAAAACRWLRTQRAPNAA